MIAPTLLVGLGGTGSKIVCRVSQMVTEEQRKRIGFAVFDTDINELREIREANPFIKTIQTSTKLTVGEYLNIDTHARDEWFPVNGILNSKSLTEGAGQVRAISRLALDTAIRAGNMEPLHNAIEELYKPKSDKTPVITPHIDRNWHIVSALPDLDEENQRRQEREIYRAFALGIICDLVCYSKISEGKYLYRLELNDLEPEEFVVSNGTPCDHYYEVLDALTINPVAVQTILSYMKEKFADERNSSGKLDFEHSYLRRQINELASIEYGKAGLSIFDVALLLKVSTPSAEFDKTVGKGIMREILTLIYEYAQTMVLEADLDGIYGKFVLEQFEMFDKNIDWYMDNWKDNFSDYINDLMRIAVSDIERKKLTDIYEKMRKIMKESSKKRG